MQMVELPSKRMHIVESIGFSWGAPCRTLDGFLTRALPQPMQEKAHMRSLENLAEAPEGTRQCGNAL